MSLTPAQLETLCARHLVPTTRYIHSKLGAEAADLTGMCLLRALQEYDAAKSPNLVGWIRQKTRLLVIDETRAATGRRGSAKHTALSSHRSLATFDASEVETVEETPLSDQEALQAAFKLMESASHLSKMVLVGRFFGNFTDTDIRKLTHASRSQVYLASRHLRGFLPPDRLPYVVRRRHPAPAGE